jgi:hypothetical protein
MKNFVYVVVAQNGLFKIGETTSVKDRFGHIKSSNACATRLFFYFEGDQRNEKTYHDLFGKKRVRGEWFALDSNDLKQLIRMAGDKIPSSERVYGREYIVELINEMNEWGFFELGKQELMRNISQVALYRCDVAMRNKSRNTWTF